MKYRRLGAMLATVIAALIFASLAFAEGSWTSYISGALTGFESRTWTDKNSDNAATVITFKGCTTSPPTGSYASARVNLRRVISLWPDEDRGDRTLNCATSGSGNWGDLPNSGSYKFKLDKINGQNSGLRLWVDTVKVTY